MNTPIITPEISEEDLGKMMTSACDAAALLKALSHEGRLMILCQLVAGERSVTELEEILGARQAAVSQQLARLRLEGLVTPRREGKTIYYSLADDRPKRVLELMYDMYCTLDQPKLDRPEQDQPDQDEPDQDRPDQAGAASN